MFRTVILSTPGNIGRAILWPILAPPVVTAADAAAYRERALAARPPGSAFTPLMTCYLRDDTDPDDVERGFREGVFTGNGFGAPPVCPQGQRQRRSGHVQFAGRT